MAWRRERCVMVFAVRIGANELPFPRRSQIVVEVSVPDLIGVFEFLARSWCVVRRCLYSSFHIRIVM